MIIAKNSPLKLVGRCLPAIRVEAVPEFSENSQAEGFADHYRDAIITTKQTVEWKPDKKTWSANLYVECWPEESKQIPYRFRIEAFGLFQVTEGVVPPDEVERFVACNAPAVLYGWCRDTLRLLTESGPYRMVELPMVFFTYPKKVLAKAESISLENRETDIT